MAYRNGTYVAFHAGGTTDPTASDIKYYNTLKMWAANKNIDFQLVNSHDKVASVRDTSSKETLRRSLVERLNNSKNMLLILTAETQKDTDWVPFEISYAIDNCGMPIIAAYPDFNSILAPHELSHYWPYALKSRIESSKARVTHIPFKLPAVLDAIGQYGIGNTDYPVNGYGYYGREAHVSFGLL